jgi:hypothetical protein
MLRRGLTFGPSAPEPLPNEVQITVLKALCTVVVSDYHPYRYGSTENDPAQQALVNQEAEQLVNQVSQLYTDTATARHEAEYALAAIASLLSNEGRDPDPGKTCKMIESKLNHPALSL